VVVGTWSDIIQFIVRLRTYSIHKMKPVVALAPHPPSAQAWKKIGIFPKVFFVQGIPSDSVDLDRAGCDLAANVVVLSSPAQSGQDKGDVSIDALPIMIFRHAKKGKANLLINLIHTSNSQFLGAMGNPKDSDLENPYYAAGQVFASSCLDTLMVQSYFNVHVVQLIERLISGYVFNIPISEFCPELVGYEFREVFKRMLENQLLALGIYRKRERSHLRFVITAPTPSTKVQAEDIIIVIDKKEVDQSFPHSIGTSTQDLHELIQKENGGKDFIQLEEKIRKVKQIRELTRGTEEFDDQSVDDPDDTSEKSARL